MCGATICPHLQYIWMLLCSCESKNVNPNLKDAAVTFVGVSEMQFHTFFYVRYPSTGPHVQSVELQELHTTVQNVPD